MKITTRHIAIAVSIVAATLSATAHAQEVDLPDLEIQQVAAGNIFVQPETVGFDVRTRGDTLSWRVRDFWGEVAATGSEPGGDVDLDGLVDEVGYYQLDVIAELDGTPIASSTTDFALLTPFDVAEVDDSPFGTVPHFLREDNFDKMPLVAKMGAKNVKEAASWESIEQQPGEYSFGRYDPLRQEQAANGLKWLPAAVYTNQFYDDNAAPYTDEGREGYADYVAGVADHYRDDVEWVEIYNEFNVAFGRRGGSPANSQADYYFPLLKESYQKIKEANPGMTVVGGAVSSVPLDWLEELFALGGLEYMDVLSVHPYVYPAEPEEAAEFIQDLKDLIKEYNDGELIPIWVTEQGYPTNTQANGVSEPTQAANLVRSYTTMFSEGVEKFFFYNLMNEGLDHGNPEHEYGLIRNVSDERGSYVPKPGYVSYAAMTRQLTGATYDRAEDLGEGVQSHVFTTADEDVRVLWSDEPTSVAVKSDHPITVTDVMGAAKMYQPHAGRVYLSLSEDPVYVTGTDIRVAVNDKITLTADRDGTVVGDPTDLTLTIDNRKIPWAPIVGAFEIGGESVPVSVRPAEKAEIAITLPAQDTTGDVTFVGELVMDGRPSARLSADTTVTEPVEIAAQHVLSAGEDTLSVAVTNLTDTELAVDEVAWSIGELTGTAGISSPMPAGATEQVEIPLTDLPVDTHDRELRIAVPGYKDVVSTGRVQMVEDTLVGVPQQSITVDGVLDDLPTDPTVDLAEDGSVGGRWATASDDAWIYGGEDDLSGQVWSTWDEDNFYLSARVQDNVHHQRNPAPLLWAGDSIQLTVSAGLPTEERPERYYDYRVGLTADGPQLYRGLTAGELPVGVVPCADMEVVRDEAAQETIYELAIPWDMLAPMEAQDGLMSVSLQVQDNDGLDRKGWISWSTKPFQLHPAQ